MLALPRELSPPWSWVSLVGTRTRGREGKVARALGLLGASPDMGLPLP